MLSGLFCGTHVCAFSGMLLFSRWSSKMTFLHFGSNQGTSELVLHVAVFLNMCLALLSGYRPKLQAELQRSVAANLRALQAEREALLEGDQAAPVK